MLWLTILVLKSVEMLSGISFVDGALTMTGKKNTSSALCVPSFNWSEHEMRYSERIPQPCVSPHGWEVDETDGAWRAVPLQALRSKGGGSESVENYFKWKLVYADLGREPAYADSMAKFADACQSTDKTSFLATADSCGWLNFLRTTISTAVVVARILIREAMPVVVHASTGCDQALQISALAQLMMDAHFRTYAGFRQLVEKEWLTMGHPFEARSSNNQSDRVKQNAFRSPVFIMFLDCVWQLTRQFPCAFEFNEFFLLALVEHSQSSRFGNFLFDCEKERIAANLKGKTNSFWGFCEVPEEKRRFVNMFYEPLPGWIKPSFRPQSIEVWFALYGAGTPYRKFHEEVHDLLMFMKDKHDTAKEEIEHKEKELAQLQAQLQAAT
eukprot:m.709889 g.709889  ORF g.709889 m.709889 type:complete len:384 (+) comp22948_c0_seq5:984-2135(+)